MHLAEDQLQWQSGPIPRLMPAKCLPEDCGFSHCLVSVCTCKPRTTTLQDWEKSPSRTALCKESETVPPSYPNISLLMHRSLCQPSDEDFPSVFCVWVHLVEKCKCGSCRKALQKIAPAPCQSSLSTRVKFREIITDSGFTDIERGWVQGISYQSSK